MILGMDEYDRAYCLVHKDKFIVGNRALDSRQPFASDHCIVKTHYYQRLGVPYENELFTIVKNLKPNKTP